VRNGGEAAGDLADRDARFGVDVGERLGAARNSDATGRAVDRLRTARSVRRRETVCEQNLLPR
jgi:hypothetical protein